MSSAVAVTEQRGARAEPQGASVPRVSLVLNGLRVGGTEMNAARTLEALGRRGVHCSVFHFEEDGPLKARILAAGHTLVHFPLVPLWSPRIIERVTSLARLLREARTDVVHAQDIYSNVLAVASGQYLAHRPVITSRRWRDEVPRKALVPLNAWAHRQSACVLPNSPSLVPLLREEGVRDAGIVVHGNFVDDAAFTPLPTGERARWRRALGIDPLAPVVGCVARLSRVKRHDILIDAFARVRSVVDNAQLVFVGDGPERADLEQRVERAGLRGQVVFTGTLPNAPLPQHLFDVAILTSESEGFPNSLVEAAAAGVPMISTMVGGVQDVLLEDETGLAIPVGDAAATADAMIALLQNPRRRASMGAAGLAHAREQFSESSALDRLLGIYARVAATRRRAT